MCPGASKAGAWPTKHSLLTTNYEPKSPSRRAGDRSDEKIVIVRGALYYEPRCIEGNYGLPGLLHGRRLEEVAFAQGRGVDPRTRDSNKAGGLEPDPLQ